MLATEPRLLEEVQLILEPPVKKIRTVSLSTTDSNFSVDTAANLTVETAPVVRTLELEGVKELFQDYDLQDAEAVSCVICGKFVLIFYTSIFLKTFHYAVFCVAAIQCRRFFPTSCIYMLHINFLDFIYF